MRDFKSMTESEKMIVSKDSQIDETEQEVLSSGQAAAR